MCALWQNRISAFPTSPELRIALSGRTLAGKTEGLGGQELGEGVIHAMGTFGGLGEPAVPYRNPASRGWEEGGENDGDGSGGAVVTASSLDIRYGGSSLPGLVGDSRVAGAENWTGTTGIRAGAGRSGRRSRRPSAGSTP